MTQQSSTDCIHVILLLSHTFFFHLRSLSLPHFSNTCTVGGDDYQPHSTELEFPTGQQQWQEDDIVQCVNIDIVDDSSVEGEHAFTVDITSVSPSSVVQCPITTTVHIQDNDGI